MYFDTCYIAKFYLNEPDSAAVRKLVRKADGLVSSQWAWLEFHAVLHRRVREGQLAEGMAQAVAAQFAQHVEAELWRLVPVTDALLRRTSALILAAPTSLFLRSGDALHLATAREAGEPEVWSNDRHLLGAAAYFGVTGRSV
jgi:predicted nucleic acid-binding protein